MTVKLFEIRDRSTFIPVMAVMLKARTEQESYLLNRVGYGPCVEPFPGVIYLSINGSSGKWACDEYEWGGRTHPVAHKYIADHFEELESGAVIDVEFILGETLTRKVSERVKEDGA